MLKKSHSWCSVQDSEARGYGYPGQHGRHVTTSYITFPYCTFSPQMSMRHLCNRSVRMYWRRSQACLPCQQIALMFCMSRCPSLAGFLQALFFTFLAFELLLLKLIRPHAGWLLFFSLVGVVGGLGYSALFYSNKKAKAESRSVVSGRPQVVAKPHIKGGRGTMTDCQLCNPVVVVCYLVVWCSGAGCGP
jgi:hypothetical protein